MLISLFSFSSTAHWRKTLIWWVEIGGISILWCSLFSFSPLHAENPDWWSQWDKHSLTLISLFSSNSTARWMKTLIWWVEVGGISTLWHLSQHSRPVPLHTEWKPWFDELKSEGSLFSDMDLTVLIQFHCMLEILTDEIKQVRSVFSDAYFIVLVQFQPGSADLGGWRQRIGPSWAWQSTNAETWGQLRKHKTHSTNVQDYES